MHFVAIYKRVLSNYKPAFLRFWCAETWVVFPLVLTCLECFCLGVCFVFVWLVFFVVVAVVIRFSFVIKYSPHSSPISLLVSTYGQLSYSEDFQEFVCGPLIIRGSWPMTRAYANRTNKLFENETFVMHLWTIFSNRTRKAQLNSVMMQNHWLT